jgi:competence protein ComEC
LSQRGFSGFLFCSAIPKLTASGSLIPSGISWGRGAYGGAGQKAADAGNCRYLAAGRTGAGRLLPWVPVAFGAGIALYFTADREPVFWVTVVPAALLCGVCWPMRRHRLFAVAVLVAAVAAGFATATFRTARIVHTALMRPLYSVALSGFVEARDIREKTDRFVLRATTMESPRGQLTLERVRLSVKKGTAPDVGSFVELKARLMPPLAALRPGSYDFARDLFFQGIGEKLEIRKPIAVARFQRS